jgi:hypothetical protein
MRLHAQKILKATREKKSYMLQCSLLIEMTNTKKRRTKRIDEDVPLHVRNIENELPRPIGIYGENVRNSIFANNTFVGIPTPIYIKGDKNIFWNNRAYFRRRR